MGKWSRKDLLGSEYQNPFFLSLNLTRDVLRLMEIINETYSTYDEVRFDSPVCQRQRKHALIRYSSVSFRSLKTNLFMELE